jgi:hypothetical protein
MARSHASLFLILAKSLKIVEAITARGRAPPALANEKFCAGKTFSFHFGKVRVEYPLCAGSLLKSVCSLSFRGAEGNEKSRRCSIFRARFLAEFVLSVIEGIFRFAQR